MSWKAVFSVNHCSKIGKVLQYVNFNTHGKMQRYVIRFLLNMPYVKQSSFMMGQRLYLGEGVSKGVDSCSR